MLTALQPVTPKDPLLRLGRYLAQKSTGPVEKKIAELVGQAREEFPAALTGDPSGEGQAGGGQQMKSTCRGAGEPDGGHLL